MNYAPAPSVLSTIVSVFRRRTPQPTFTPVFPYPAQGFVTQHTITDLHASYPVFADPFGKRSKPELLQCKEFLEEAKLPNAAYPESPRAPNPQCTTFVLPLRLSREARYRDYENDSSISTTSEVDLNIPPGHTIVCHPTEPGVYAAAEPKTLAKALFLYGFLFPAFWLVGLAILFIPLRPTPDWEAGKTSAEVESACRIIRETELRWAKRCLYALLFEVLFVIVVLVIP